MHICFITSEYPKKGFSHGGVGSFINALSLELVKNNIQVSIIGINNDDFYEEEFINGVKIYRLKPSSIKGLKWFFNSKEINSKLKQIHSQNGVNIVETPELGLAFLQKIKKVKYIIRLHGGHHFLARNQKTHWWKAFQEKKSFKKADAFIAISNHIKTETESLLGFNNKRVAQIYNPINLDFFKPNHDIKPVPYQILFIGTVYEKKGIIELIRAFQIVKKQIPEATLEIYGKDWFFADGSSFIEKLKKEEINQLNTDYIHFNGAIPHSEIPQKYAQASVCVFPSLMEAQGLVVIEAMAMEKIVVFTEFGPGKEVIENYKTGLLCNPNNPEDIAEKIIWTFNNKENVEIIEKNARKSILEKFNLEKIVHQNISFYKSLF
jgi:glycosyltransferase involved in cell wall biosynthesis